MARDGHPYKTGERGRALRSLPGVGGMTRWAQLECSQCAKTGELKIRNLLPPDQIDLKFRQSGWKLDPHICTDCQRINSLQKEANKVTATPSVAAMKAQAQMFQLLSDNFDVDAGRYNNGYSDTRIASETGLKNTFVREFRIAAFGEIKEPEFITKLKNDLKSIEDLQREQNALITEEIAKIRSRLSGLPLSPPHA